MSGMEGLGHQDLECLSNLTQLTELDIGQVGRYIVIISTTITIYLNYNVLTTTDLVQSTYWDHSIPDQPGTIEFDN